MSLDPQRHPGIADVFYAQRVRERVARGVLEARVKSAGGGSACASSDVRTGQAVGTTRIGAFHRILQGLRPQ